jgi:predicted flap endonuclease-1-like 5' DNA nuclease
MIWHFFEVWVLLLATFVVGCGLGAALYAGIAGSPLATVQGVLADSIGDVVDVVKSRLGFTPDWREDLRLPIERPRRQAAPGRERRAAEEDYADELDPVPVPDHAEEEWQETEDVEVDRVWETMRRYAEEEDPGRPPEEVEPYVSPPPAAPEREEEIVPKRPAGLSGPRNGVADNLRRIRGIGKGNEELLNSFGIYHFGQIAAWTPSEARWVADRLPFPERIERDDWIGQATVLASGGDTGHLKSADRRRARRAGNEPEDGSSGK